MLIKMKNKKVSFQLLFRIFVIIGMFIAGAIFYNKLPDQIPTHWNVNGMADAWGDKSFALWISPVLSLLMVVLFPLLSKIDPKKENYKLFKNAWDTIQTILISFFGYVFALQIYFTLNTDNNQLFSRLMTAGIGVIFMLLGNLLGKVRQNYFIGFRTPWAINDPEVWQKSQRFAGWIMFFGGFVFFLEAFIWQYFFAAFIFVIVLIIAAPLVYSYLISRKK